VSFTTKYIEVDFSLDHGVFANGGNTYTAKGCRISAQITKAGGLSFGEALISIYGLPLSVMNQLGTFGNVITVLGRNTVTVKAGEDPNNLTTIYTGTSRMPTRTGGHNRTCRSGSRRVWRPTLA